MRCVIVDCLCDVIVNNAEWIIDHWEIFFVTRYFSVTNKHLLLVIYSLHFIVVLENSVVVILFYVFSYCCKGGLWSQNMFCLFIFKQKLSYLIQFLSNIS